MTSYLSPQDLRTPLTKRQTDLRRASVITADIAEISMTHETKVAAEDLRVRCIVEYLTGENPTRFNCADCGDRTGRRHVNSEGRSVCATCCDVCSGGAKCSSVTVCGYA